jgi:hypothetical protein
MRRPFAVIAKGRTPRLAKKAASGFMSKDCLQLAAPGQYNSPSNTIFVSFSSNDES